MCERASADLSTGRHACRAYFGNGHSEDTSAITQDEQFPSLGAAAKASHLTCDAIYLPCVLSQLCAIAVLHAYNLSCRLRICW